MTDPLSISASITALLQLTSTVIQYLSGVKGAPEDRQRILSELASVIGFLYTLEDQADKAKQGDQWSSTLQSLNVPKGPLDQLRRALERLSSKLAPSATGLKKVSKAITWPFQKEEIREILGSIERQKALFNLARQNDHIRLSEAIKEDVATMREEVAEIAKGVSTIKMSQITSEHLSIIKWLDAPDPSTNYNRALKTRNPKTGSWFIKSKEFADWNTARGSFIWLHGIPGCGKTILSSTILQDVLEQHHSEPHSAVLFFYFDFNDAEKQRHEKVIRSLICQLSRYCGSPILQNLYSSCLNGRSQPTEEVLLDTLRQMMTSLGDTYIILDALDECAERDELLPNLEKIVSWEGANVHLLTTSRREKDIEEALTPMSDTRNRISIQSALVNADIRTYIRDRLQIDPRLKRWLKRPEVQREIEDTLMKKADGMFRWAACQLDSVGNCFHLPHLRQALVSLPKTLDDTYARILCNIDKDYNHYNRYILKILQWLTFSARPLQLEEIAEIVVIDIDETPRFDPLRRLPEPRDILTICSSLITLTKHFNNEESGGELSENPQDPDPNRVAEVSDPENSTTYVRLAHFSVKEYLVSDRIQHGTAPHYRIREIESHGVLAEDCLAYLLQFDEPGSLTDETLELSPLAGYAAKFWPHHAKLAEKASTKSTTLLSTELLMSDREGFLSWIRICNPDRNYRKNLRRRLDDLAPPLYYASLAGLFESVRMLIEWGMDVNVKGGVDGNALQAACLQGHIDVVGLLLDNGANVNAQGGFYGNALQIASFKGDIDVIHVLLDNGANINAQGGYYGNALQAASVSGHIDVVGLLLDNGADVNAHGGNYGNALQAASYLGRIDVIPVLLDNGANVNARGGDFGSALQAASASYPEYIDVVHILLDNGANVNAQSGDYGSALCAACAAGKKKTVKLLLDNGADVNALGNASWGSALKTASEKGEEDIVKMLLDKGANVNAPSGSPLYSPLRAASKRGHGNVVKLLLDNGADVKADDKYRRSALLEASRQGHENVVKVLLDNGANVNDPNGSPWYSPLWAASRRGCENVVKMLIAKGAVIPKEKGIEEGDPPAQHFQEIDPIPSPAGAD